MIEADVDVPKGQAKPRPANCHPLLLHLWLPLVVFFCSNWGNTPYATTTGSKTGVDLEVVFLVGLQNTLLEAYMFEHPAQDSQYVLRLDGRYVLQWQDNVVV